MENRVDVVAVEQRFDGVPFRDIDEFERTDCNNFLARLGPMSRSPVPVPHHIVSRNAKDSSEPICPTAPVTMIRFMSPMTIPPFFESGRTSSVYHH